LIGGIRDAGESYWYFLLFFCSGYGGNTGREDEYKNRSKEEAHFLLSGEGFVSGVREAEDDKRAEKGVGIPGASYL